MRRLAGGLPVARGSRAGDGRAAAGQVVTRGGPAARPGVRLALVLLAGLALRLVCAPLASFEFDLDVLRGWAVRLTTVPLASFYDTQALTDHLPGDLWLLWALARVYRLATADLELRDPSFLLLLKLVPAFADVGIAALLYLLGRRVGEAGTGLRAAALYLFNPAVLFLTAVWGQWDPLSAGLALAAVLLLLAGRPEWALPALTYAALIKPPLGALAPLLALAYLRRYILPHTPLARQASGGPADRPPEPLGRSLWRGAVAVGASLAIMLVVLLPFDVGLPGMPTRWTLPERIAHALDKSKYTSNSAFNLWTTGLPGTYTPPAGVPPFDQSDVAPWLFGLTYQTGGTLLFAAACLLILAAYWRWGGTGEAGDRALVWAAFGAMLAMFVLPTRGHERHLLPAVVFAAGAAALGLRGPRGAWGRWLYAGLSLSYFANLYYLFGFFYAVPKLGIMYTTNLLPYAMSLLNVALLVAVLALLLRGRVVAGAAAAARAPAAHAGGEVEPVGVAVGTGERGGRVEA